MSSAIFCHFSLHSFPVFGVLIPILQVVHRLSQAHFLSERKELITLVPEVFLLSGAPKVRTSGEAKPNSRESLAAHVRFFECTNPIRSRFDVSESKSNSKEFDRSHPTCGIQLTNYNSCHSTKHGSEIRNVCVQRFGFASLLVHAFGASESKKTSGTRFDLSIQTKDKKNSLYFLMHGDRIDTNRLG